MKKAILPSKTYLVCSSGMMKAELQVFSQLTVFNDNKNRKIATKDDRFGDFMCKYALILGALVAGALLASGGSLAAIMLTIVIATGISLSMCAIVNLFNAGGWQKIHPTVFVEQKNVLTDKSYFNCPIGGTIIPIYDENIASRQAEIFRQKATTEIFMSAVGGYFLGGYMVSSITAQAGFGTFAGGMGFGFLVGVAVSKIEDSIKDSAFGEMTERQKSSPIYHNDNATNDLEYYAPKMTGDVNTVKTVTKAKDLSENKDKIINDKVNERLDSKTGRNGGLLKNEPKKNAKTAKANGKLSNKEYMEIRKNLAEQQIKDLKANDGAAQYKSEHMKNLRESGSRFAEGFKLKDPAGRLFWGATLTELISMLITEKLQRSLLEDSIEAEAKMKTSLGIFTVN